MAFCVQLSVCMAKRPSSILSVFIILCKNPVTFPKWKPKIIILKTLDARLAESRGNKQDFNNKKMGVKLPEFCNPTYTLCLAVLVWPFGPALYWIHNPAGCSWGCKLYSTSCLSVTPPDCILDCCMLSSLLPTALSQMDTHEHKHAKTCIHQAVFSLLKMSFWGTPVLAFIFHPEPLWLSLYEPPHRPVSQHSVSSVLKGLGIPLSLHTLQHWSGRRTNCSSLPWSCNSIFRYGVC